MIRKLETQGIICREFSRGLGDLQRSHERMAAILSGYEAHPFPRLCFIRKFHWPWTCVQNLFQLFSLQVRGVDELGKPCMTDD